MSSSVCLRLPATSANLGPGFDALGLALNFALHVEAREANTYRVQATGRDTALCSDVDSSLILQTYRSVLHGNNMHPVPLHLDLHNEIPLGIGCGSSAAALVAGVALASHVGGLRWDVQQILTEASLREGHPDNVAACVLGDLTVSAMYMRESEPALVDALSITPPVRWPLLLAMPAVSLSTKTARALLPDSYSKADAIANVQNVSMLTAAFAQGRGDLLARAMQDCLHQPYRLAACPLLQDLLPLSGKHGILGVALSGAGPSVLLVLRDEMAISEATHAVLCQLAAKDNSNVELVTTRMGCGATLS